MTDIMLVGPKTMLVDHEGRAEPHFPILFPIVIQSERFISF